MKKKKIEIEYPVEGKPHSGEVLAVIGPHSDDFSIFASGTVAKLIKEGYAGYFIRVTNDEMDSYDLSLGATVLANESDTQAVSKILRVKRVFDLNYKNHYINQVPPGEIRNRLIFLFRFLKIDTVLSFDPWAHYEENPDHYITAQEVEAACWMAGGRLDLPEHFEVGLSPHSVKEKYYWARGPQMINRVVDISGVIEDKINAICANKTQIRNMVLKFRDDLATQGLTLSWFDEDEENMNKKFIEMRFKELAAQTGKQYDLNYAETFHYIGPKSESTEDFSQYIEQYIKENAVHLK